MPAMELPEELIDRAMSAYAMARLAGQHVDDAGNELLHKVAALVLK